MAGDDSSESLVSIRGHVRRIADALEEQPIAPHSIELQRAKDGTYYFTIKVYFETGDEGGALTVLSAVDYALRDRYLPKATGL